MVNWKQAAKDCLALGSIPFYGIVMARALVGLYPLFIYQLSISAILLFAVSFYYKADFHIARALVLVVFTCLFYMHLSFTIFASVLFLLIIFCAYYLKRKRVLQSLIIGAAVCIVSYFLSPVVQNLIGL